MPHGVIVALILATSVHARDLSLAERIEAHRAVQRVYHAHQVGNTSTFEDAVPWSVSEAQVLAMLKLDATPDALAREADRIRRNTKNPAMLREIERALGDDDALFAEIVARRTLASRAVDAGNDTTCAGDDSWIPGTLEGIPERTRHTIVWTGTHAIVWGGLRASVGTPYLLGSGFRYDPPTDTWARISSDGAPAARADHTAVWTGKEMIVWGGWPSSNGGRYDPVLDRWSPIATTNQPSARAGHVAVWTGREMIVWGGTSDGSGGRYDPALDRWTATATTNAPADRDDATAVWTGSVMVVWGGQDPNQTDVPFDTGGRYDPNTNTWSATSTTNAPSARWGHAAAWTGSSMLIWGGTPSSTAGSELGDGRRYDPTADAWTPITMTGAPTARSGASSAWTGSSWIVWGGDGTGTIHDGRRYDPTADTWSAMASPGFSVPSGSVPAVWSGAEMIVWGGGNDDARNSGGRYDPTTNTWVATSLGSGPSARFGNTAVWTGTEMIVWGGISAGQRVNTGARFDPTLDAWLPLSTTNAPGARSEHVAAWTGARMVVWGGRDGNGVLGDGGRYDPLTDQWSSVAATNAPSARARHAAVWTGSRLVVWGGQDATNAVVATGGRYDPSSDTWAATSTTNAPVARQDHTATWNGTRMIVWGGRANTATSRLRSGGRYDPVGDTWQATSMTGAPEARSGHVAAWVGERLVVWGGASVLESLGTGGRYEPLTDTWSPTSPTGAPSQRTDAAAISTGTELVVWGGDLLPSGSSSPAATGGRYDPTGNTWKPLSTENVPFARTGPTAVWTGELMLVWGGGLDTGGTYVVGPPDADADGVADACDCASGDATATSVPNEAASLRFASDKTALTWYASTGGSGTVHDVVRGTLATFPVGSGGESCLASDLGESRLDDPSTPASGGYWYLVRGRNACGSGTYGDATGGTRATQTCP